jgi:N-acetylmuramoyl-L-alanine amidase
LSVKLIAHPAVVVIDPGHGGIDRGGMPGQSLPEKPYTLDVAKRLARILDGTDDIKVVLNRQPRGDLEIGSGRLKIFTVIPQGARMALGVLN